MKIIISVIAITAAALAGPVQAGPRFIEWCEDDVPAGTKTLEAGAPDIAAHRLFPLPEVHYKGRLDLSGDFDMWLQIDPQGRIACFDHVGPMERPFALTDERVAVLNAAVRWRYTPFLTDGKPARALIVEHIREDVDATRTPMPVGRLYDTRIRLEDWSYSVEMKGDGQVRFDGDDFSDVQGRHTYSLSTGEVAALIERLRGRDLWSMRGDYSAWVSHGALKVLTVSVGGQTKVVRDYMGRMAGMPEEVGLMQADIADTSRASGLVTLNAEGLRILDGEGFDFKGKPGADLLVRVIQNEYVADDVVTAVLDRGAPLTGGDKPREAHDYDEVRPRRAALDAALIARRDAVVPRLIDAGALLVDGKPDRRRVDSAFQSAVFGGRLDFVERLATYHPSMTYGSVDWHDEDGAAVTTPVTLLLYRGGAIIDDREDRPDQDFAIARYLNGLGCDINGKDASGTTLLMVAADKGDVEFVRWLLDHGADIKAVNKDGESALNQTYDEDAALVLLEAGADPALQPEYGATLFSHALDWKWSRVIAWLEAHGYGEQLKANAQATGVTAPVVAASGAT